MGRVLGYLAKYGMVGRLEWVWAVERQAVCYPQTKRAIMLGCAWLHFLYFGNDGFERLEVLLCQLARRIIAQKSRERVGGRYDLDPLLLPIVLDALGFNEDVLFFFVADHFTPYY